MAADAPPSIAVIMPVYNRAAMVRRAIDSVLDQDFADFELIVADDGSTDQTCEVVTAVPDPRVTLLRAEKNQGSNAARNRGIKAARAELIAFLDSDDVYLPNKLGFIVRPVPAKPRSRRAPRQLHQRISRRKRSQGRPTPKSGHRHDSRFRPRTVQPAIVEGDVGDFHQARNCAAGRHVRRNAQASPGLRFPHSRLRGRPVCRDRRTHMGQKLGPQVRYPTTCAHLLGRRSSFAADIQNILPIPNSGPDLHAMLPATSHGSSQHAGLPISGGMRKRSSVSFRRPGLSGWFERVRAKCCYGNDRENVSSANIEVQLLRAKELRKRLKIASKGTRNLSHQCDQEEAERDHHSEWPLPHRQVHLAALVDNVRPGPANLLREILEGVSEAPESRARDGLKTLKITVEACGPCPPH